MRWSMGLGLFKSFSFSFFSFILNIGGHFLQVWTNYYKIKVNFAEWYARRRTRANSSRFSFSSRRKRESGPRQQLNNCRHRPTSQTSKGILAPVEQRAPLFVTRNKRHHARSFRISNTRTVRLIWRDISPQRIARIPRYTDLQEVVVFEEWSNWILNAVVARVCLSRFSIILLCASDE